MIRSTLARPFAAWIVRQQRRWSSQPVETQFALLKKLVHAAKDTLFGKAHHFSDIKHYDDFRRLVPIRDYEDFQPYIQRIIKGESNVLWRGKPAYFAKTSGTTSGVKYIPLSRESVPYHIQAARDALMCYAHQTDNFDFLDRKLIFLSGSPVLEKKGDILTGRLSGIVNHHVPAWLRGNQMPSYATNCIEDWEEKLNRIVEETLQADMSLISGIPPWVQMYFDRICERTGKKISQVFPNFSVFVYGGVNFQPYKAKIFDSIGKIIDSVETYPASEGFIAYQDSQEEPGLLLLLNHGIFYEFVPAEEYFKPNPPRLHIGQVELGVNYALIMSTNAGLWSYSIGDTVKFVSKNPYRLVVTGRIKHFISAFGEHVIGEEVEKALEYALRRHPETMVTEFTVAPQVNPPQGGKPYHEWLIAFAQQPHNLEAFARDIDQQLRQLNCYYDDLIRGNILRQLVITPLPQDAFIHYMKSLGKLGGQNKVPRLSNTRQIADELLKFHR
ncbi:MAG: GH3 auxin-responsive promoter family protein [Cytophagales bacterium]|nr:GH3 auxin-responsive promoter family protein [Bernardetiaceae bacterium]MDW8209574.1 GH3 auxin-responsive promoter family protein [Cytophagales bacterium]